jgi:hypothetical protein
LHIRQPSLRFPTVEVTRQLGHRKGIVAQASKQHLLRHERMAPASSAAGGSRAISFVIATRRPLS